MIKCDPLASSLILMRRLNLMQLQLISFFLEYLSQEPYASLDRQLLLVSGAESQLLTFLGGELTSSRPVDSASSHQAGLLIALSCLPTCPAEDSVMEIVGQRKVCKTSTTSKNTMSSLYCSQVLADGGQRPAAVCCH